MNINGLWRYPQSIQRFDLAKRGNSAAYGRMLSDAQQTDQPLTIHLYLPTENTLYSGGTGAGCQTVYAEYTADSTAEDPIVRIRGQSSGGEYDFTCRISDIDPERASYAEMCALWGHLRKTGALSFQFGGGDRPVVPYGVEVGDVTRRQNYMGMIDRMTTSNRFDQANQVSARELLELYQTFTGKDSTSGVQARNPNAILSTDSVPVKLEKLRKIGEAADYTGMSYVEIYREIYDRYQRAFGDILPAAGIIGGDSWGDIYNQFGRETWSAVYSPFYREIEAESGYRYGQQEFFVYKNEHYGRRLEADAMGYEGMSTQEIEQAIVEKYAGRDTLFDFAGMVGELYQTGVLDEKMGPEGASAYRGMVMRKIIYEFFPSQDLMGSSPTDAEWQNVMHRHFDAQSFVLKMKESLKSMGFANWDFDIRSVLDRGLDDLLATLGS